MDTQDSSQGSGTHAGSGTRALIGVFIAVLGAAATVLPNNPVMKALGEVAPQLASAIPTLVTACGTLIAAFSAPPRLTREVQPVIQLRRRNP